MPRRSKTTAGAWRISSARASTVVCRAVRATPSSLAGKAPDIHLNNGDLLQDNSRDDGEQSSVALWAGGALLRRYQSAHHGRTLALLGLTAALQQLLK